MTNVDFAEFVTLVRNDMMGLLQQPIPVKKMARNLGLDDPSDLQASIEALGYLMLHMAKVKANPEEFSLIYQNSGLNRQKAFEKVFHDVVFFQLDEIRQILNQENLSDVPKFNDLEWRLSLITATRARQKMMLPKYTVKLDIQPATKAVGAQEVQGKNEERGDQQIDSVIFDSDYTNLKKLQKELEDALKSVNGRYAKKVVKFIQ